jgi:hypothetical protein
MPFHVKMPLRMKPRTRPDVVSTIAFVSVEIVTVEPGGSGGAVSTDATTGRSTPAAGTIAAAFNQSRRLIPEVVCRRGLPVVMAFLRRFRMRPVPSCHAAPRDRNNAIKVTGVEAI